MVILLHTRIQFDDHPPMELFSIEIPSRIAFETALRDYEQRGHTVERSDDVYTVILSPGNLRYVHRLEFIQ